MVSPERRNSDVNDVVTGVLGGRQPSLGTPEDFEALYRNAFPRVYAYVASLLRDRSAAEDVTAAAFERAYRKRRAHLETEPVDLASPGPDEQAERSFRREEVRAALASLDPRDRDLVALKFAGGLSNGEIARVLGISETNVGSRLHRAVEKLRKACQS